MKNYKPTTVLSENDPEMLRKKERKRDGYHFISDKRFEQLTVEIRKRGAIIYRGGEEIEDYLDSRNAGALTVGDVLFFRNQVTISEVLEEVYHFKQNEQRLNDCEEIKRRSILNEIDAKMYLLKVAVKYKIPRKEIEETLYQLNKYKMMLNEMEEEDDV